MPRGPVHEGLVAQTPLYNPNPGYWNPKHVIETKQRIRRCHLSDFAIVALLVLVDANYLTKKSIKVFRSAFCARDARIKRGHKHQGYPALAPDKTVMQADVREGRIDGKPPVQEPFDGGQKGLHPVHDPPWTPETVKNCDGYAEWLEKLKMGDEAGGPFPTDAELNAMDNATRAWNR